MESIIDLDHVTGGGGSPALATTTTMVTLAERALEGHPAEFYRRLSQMAPWWNPADIQAGLHWISPRGVLNASTAR